MRCSILELGAKIPSFSILVHARVANEELQTERKFEIYSGILSQYAHSREKGFNVFVFFQLFEGTKSGGNSSDFAFFSFVRLLLFFLSTMPVEFLRVEMNETLTHFQNSEFLRMNFKFILEL